jgi:O-antigen/teichoic acid export membrane protein
LVESGINDEDNLSGPESAPSGRGLGLKRLGGNAALTFAAQMGAALIGLAISVLLGRTLGTSGLGTYASALLLSNLMWTLLELGITYANVYHIASGDVNTHDVMRANIRIWVVLSAFGLVVSGGIIYFRGAQLFPGIPMALLVIGLASFPPNLLQFYYQSILQGYQDFKRFNLLTVIVQLTTFIVSAILILGFHQGVVAALWAFLLGQILSLAITLWVLRPYLVRTPETEVHESWWVYGRKAVNYGWKQHLSAVISYVNLRIDYFFVQMFLGQSLGGVYYAAIQMAEAMWIISKVISTVLLPRLAELRGKEETRQQLTPLITRLVVAATALASVAAALLARPFALLAWHGPKFAQAAVVLWWLLPGIVMWSATRIVAYDFSARGRPELNSYLAGIVLVVNVALNVILIPRLGMIGGAVATTVSYTLNTFATLYLYRQFNDIPFWKMLVMQPEDFVLLRDAASMAIRRLKHGSEASV